MHVQLPTYWELGVKVVDLDLMLAENLDHLHELAREPKSGIKPDTTKVDALPSDGTYVRVMVDSCADNYGCYPDVCGAGSARTMLHRTGACFRLPWDKEFGALGKARPPWHA